MNRSVLLSLLLISFTKGYAQVDGYKKLLQSYHTQKNFSGTVLIATNGKTSFLGSIGMADRLRGKAIGDRSKFKIASVTKTFTAVLILQLVEQGKISLAGTIGAYLPEYTGEASNRVTIEHLITYSSGIPNCDSYEGDKIYAKPISVDSFITKYCSGKPEAEPGSRFSYNNGDYILLGRIIEKVTGRSFEENLTERILKPLKMMHTHLYSGSQPVQDLTMTYSFNDSTKSFVADHPYYLENFFSAGAMYSTAEDLLKFNQGIFDFKLLKKETVERMLTPYPKLDNVGLGFWVADKYGSFESTFVYRPGGIYGATANWIHVTGSGKTVIVLSNTNATNLFEMSQQLNAVEHKQGKTIRKH
jgi:CubicO group peptidase (beta-lactamase class C family)